MTRRYQQGEDLKDQGPRQEHISVKHAVPQKRKKKRGHIILSSVIKEGKLSKALPFSGLSWGPTVITHVCVHIHVHRNTHSWT